MELGRPDRARRGARLVGRRRSSPTPAARTAAMATFGFATPASRRIAWTIAVVAEIALAIGVAAGSDRAAYLAAALMLLFALTLGSALMRGPRRGPVRLLRRRLDGRSRRRRPRPAASRRRSRCCRRCSVIDRRVVLRSPVARHRE